MYKNEKGFSAVEGLLILVTVGVIGFVGWYVWQSKNEGNKATNTDNAASQTNKDKQAEEQAKDLYEGWKTYTNNDYAISFRYPADWTVEAESVPHSSHFSIWISKVLRKDVLEAKGQGLDSLRKYNSELVVSAVVSSEQIKTFPSSINSDVLETITFNDSVQYFLVAQTYNDEFTGTWLMNCRDTNKSECSVWVPTSKGGAIDIRIESAGNAQASTVPVNKTSEDFNIAKQILKSFEF